MAAHSEDFPWPSHYGHFNFFEERMREHHKVRQLHKRGNGVYEIELKSGNALRVFICECYSFGMAEYYEVKQNLGKVDVIVISSAWCGYTDDVKLHSRQIRVGVFNIRDFMAALNRERLWEYLNDDEKERFKGKL